MGPQTEQEDFLKKNHPLQVLVNTLGEVYEFTTEALPDVYIYWGVDEIDRTGENQWDSKFIGVLGYDDKFNPALP